MRSNLLHIRKSLCCTTSQAFTLVAAFLIETLFAGYCSAQTVPKKPSEPKFWIVAEAHSVADSCDPRDIYVMDQKGENVKQLTSNHQAHNPSWSPDGGRIAFLQDERMPIGGFNPKFHACGCVENFLKASRDVYSVSANGGSPSLVAAISPNAQDTLWLPDGKHIAVRMADKNNLLVHVFGDHLPSNHQALEPLDRFLEIQEPLECFPGRGIQELAPPMDNFLPEFFAFFDPFSGGDNTQRKHGMQYSADLGSSLRVVSIAGDVTSVPVPAYDIAWSRDGKRIAYSIFTGTQYSILYVADLHGIEAGTAHALTEQQLDANGPAWSADGSRIAFSALWKESSQIFIINADGSNRIQLSRDANTRCDHASWSPDDRWIVAACSDDRIGSSSYVLRGGNDSRSKIYLFDTSKPGAKPRQLTSCVLQGSSRSNLCGARNPSFAPAGTVIQ